MYFFRCLLVNKYRSFNQSSVISLDSWLMYDWHTFYWKHHRSVLDSFVYKGYHTISLSATFQSALQVFVSAHNIIIRMFTIFKQPGSSTLNLRTVNIPRNKVSQDILVVKFDDPKIPFLLPTISYTPWIFQSQTLTSLKSNIKTNYNSL